MTGTAVRRRRWPIVLIGIALLIGAAAAAVLALPTFGAKASSERLARMQADPHFHDGRFVNDVPPAGYTFADVRALVAGQFLGDEVRTPPMPLTGSISSRRSSASGSMRSCRSYRRPGMRRARQPSRRRSDR